MEGDPTSKPAEPEKSEKAKAKEEAKRLKMEKFAQKQAKMADQAKKRSNDPKQTNVEKLTQVLEDIQLEDIPEGQMKNVKDQLLPNYNSRFVEHGWYSYWEKNGFFRPECDLSEARKAGCLEQDKSSRFSMVIPPPNVTGTLHIGHAFTMAIQDSIIRWNRMHGRYTVWVPGADHAGIATQVVVEKKIQREQGKTRHDLGREAFVKEVWKWKEEKGGSIYDQLRRLGCSLDWTRAVFTLDPMMVRAVNEAFKRLFKSGDIKRNKRLVNWSCKLKSAISDIEVDHQELTGRTTIQVPGYERRIEFGIIETFAYEVYSDDKKSIETKIWVSTTRLETMLGDTAIAVHPEDQRYKELIGKFARHPFCDRLLKIVGDAVVDKEFGTGAVKITPAHDFEDYQKGLRHNLEFIDIYTDDGLIVQGYGKFSGMKRFDARFAIREELKSLGLLTEEKPKDNPMTIPICSRSKDVIEPRLKEQWFLDCVRLATVATEAARNNQLTFNKNYVDKWYRWMNPESIKNHPWCLSRQLWWGHRIPAYKAYIKGQTNFTWVSGIDLEDATKEAKLELKIDDADQIILEQDEDVLDTWFSSGLFPFSVHGWPDKTPSLEKYYPLDLMETGEDILFFWVARMVMLGIALTDTIPFRHVFLHSIVRDAEGRKMSKSLGNVVDPIDVINGINLEGLQSKLKDSNLDEKEYSCALAGQKKLFPSGIPECGTDALRFKLVELCTGTDVHLRIDQLVGDRLLCNKIWQAFKFASIHFGDFKMSFCKMHVDQRTLEDKKVLNCLLENISESNKGFESYVFRRATVASRKFWREDFCSFYIEYIKKLKQESSLGPAQLEVMFISIDYGLRLLHPIMPFITEELWQRLMASYMSESYPPSISLQEYPTYARTVEKLKIEPDDRVLQP